MAAGMIGTPRVICPSNSETECLNACASFRIPCTFQPNVACPTPTGSRNTPPAASSGLTDPLDTGGSGVYTIIGRLISLVVGITGSVALVMLVWGGAHWIWSAGTAKAVEHGRNVFKNAAIGLVIIFTSYTLLKNVFTILGS